MKVAVARAGAAAVGARGAECGGGRPGACSRGRSPRRERWQHALDFSALQANWGWTAGEQENGLPSPRDMNHQLWITQLAEVGSARPQSHTLPARHRLVLRSARLHPALTSCDPVSLHRTVGARVCSLLEENSVKEKKKKRKHRKAQQKRIGHSKSGTSTEGCVMLQNDLSVYLLTRRMFAYIAK
ncbi:uncharacterized protein LOC107497017 isoform X2 [Rousettus aegyptiacus]|uniref:uncharacterized protein LOC107497017 isoform X2 n=1 Tax=Rousettus aegyptiacus TaxID=9407 RepID=UPI00168D8B89|nr:uncharacterized protein LOC107497017 isoform X2 [Rousettus aegyptiacus]